MPDALPPPRVLPPHIIFDRSQWARLRSSSARTTVPLDLQALGGVNDPALQSEVEDILFPLARLIDIHIEATRELNHIVQSTFAEEICATVPYIIAIAGSVAVGKSTLARLLQAVLVQSEAVRQVDLITTDGFLYPTKKLQDEGLMERKGFPESYDLHAMLDFLAAVKACTPHLRVPVYSHEAYDIVPDQFQVVDRPDILIFEGLNVLQTKNIEGALASDFFDFTIYLDAKISLIEKWYVERFLKLQHTIFQKQTSYFHHYKDLNRSDATKVARNIWQKINLPNLVENIAPTRRRARIVLRKGDHHQVEEVWLRQT